MIQKKITLGDNNIVLEINASVRQATEMDEPDDTRTNVQYNLWPKTQKIYITPTQTIERLKDWNQTLNPHNNTYIQKIKALQEWIFNRIKYL